jgi:hypothetical protein
MKKLYTILFFAGICSAAAAQTTLISSTVNNGGFESGAAGWTIVNGAQTNRWFIGNNFQCAGANGAYIGTAAGNNNYTVTAAASTVHLYRDFTFPAGETDITLTFDLRCGGESTFDHIRVFLISTATTPVAGTQLPVGNRIGNAQYNLNAGCTNYSITLNPAVAGTTQRLVFQWRNDGSIGTQPAATLDNVTLITQVPPLPNCATMTTPANGATNVCESSVTLNWTAPVGGGAPTGYKLYFGTNNFPTNIVNGTNLGLVLTYNPGVLLPSTTYYWCIVPTNGSGDAVGCTVFSFTTGAGCYIQAQTGTVNYTSCGGSFYDPGGTGNYTNSANGVTTFCPSVAGQYVEITFSSFSTEACCDFLTIYNGNSTAAPVIGTYSGTTVPCNITSTDATGCLTFRWVSDGSVVSSGWVATVNCVGVPAPAFPGSICGNAPSITMPYTATGQTTTCYGNDYSNVSTGSCGTLYESGEDHVYELTVTQSTCIGITLSNCSSTNIGFQVYSGCPGTAGTTCIGSAGGSNPLSGNITLPAAGSYYIIVDSWSAPMSVNYDIAVADFGSGPVNDLPCSATALALNVNLSGDNTCSGAASEPAAATCWTAGNLNTVWYTVVCPASGQLRIRTTLGSLTNTQIALYSGTCGSLTEVACNDNAPACGTSSYNNSEITATGLTPGATYFIRVDGANNLSGTFDILAVDGAVGFLPAAGQDCSSPNPVCAASIAVGNPGYQAYGNICDFPGGGGNCLLSGERGSVWYTIPINAAGTLTFDIVPNDWPGAPSTASTDYDFAVWKIAGAGSTTCAGIAAGAVPLRCNYSGLGVTGIYTVAGTSPPAYPGFGGAYDANIAVANGDVYVLCISNFSNSTSGFTINFGGAAPINYTAAGNTVSWTGGNNTSWLLAANWGGCTPPVCGINAVVGPSSANQPILTPGNYYVNDLTINSGGVLTLQAGAILHICGNFTNSGSIVASPTSTIMFDNAAATHTMTGAFVGTDGIGNLTITQTGGSVILANNVDLKGNFTTSNATSVFNINGRYLKVAGNFSNSATATFTGVAGSTLEFNGSGGQTYNHGTGGVALNNVVMNNTGAGVTLLSNIAIATGTLTLTQGRFITNALSVNVTNSSPTACTPGNTTSFVQGNMNRVLNGAAASYDFPVGSATTGYQRANITFTTTTTIPFITARFDNYAPPNGPAANECPNNTYATLPMFNNGYWTLTASANPTNGVYTTTLYPTNQTNNTGLGWTVAKGTSTATFALNGACAPSTAAQVVRTGMNGFSVFGVAQSTAPLPVEFVSFTGVALDEKNQLSWTTASETNSQFFYIERSDDGVNFNTIGRKDGAGTTSQIHHYSFDDFSPIEGTNYYRLRQVDFNGATMYSNIIALDFHRGNMTVMNVKPNPTNGEVNFDFSSPVETTIHILITDVTGRVVKDQNVVVKPGTTLVNTAIEESGAGVYTMIITDDKHAFRSVSRIVKY